MNYIVFDLEWNQCPFGKGRENEKLPFEIIEIGAIKLNDQGEQLEEFHRVIRPVVYKKLHFRTQELMQLHMDHLAVQIARKVEQMRLNGRCTAV